MFYISDEYIEEIFQNDELFNKFKNFEENQNIFQCPKEDYINRMTELIYDQYINNNIKKSYNFHRFVIIILGPIIKEDPKYIFKNKLLNLLANKNKTYDDFIKGVISLEKEELALIVKKDIADMLSKNEFNLEYFTNFINSTINDDYPFKRSKNVDDLALDYVVYHNIAKIIIDNYKEHIETALKVIGLEKIRELNIMARIDILDLNSKDVTENASHEVIKGKHHITISERLINNYKKEYHKKDLAKIIAIVYHEAQHAYQYEQYYNSDLINYKILLWSKEELARNSLGDKYYRENYHSYIYESDANYVGWKNAQLYFNETLKDYSLDEYFKDNMNIYKAKRKKPYHKDIKNIAGQGVVEYEAASLLNVITALCVKKDPSLLKIFPILRVEYNNDGSIKTAVEKIKDKELLTRKLEEEYMFDQHNFLNNLITKEEIEEKKVSFESNKFDINRMYDFILTRFVDNHIDALLLEVDSLINLEGDFTNVLVNIIRAVFSNFYNENLSKKAYPIQQKLVLIAEYIIKKRDELDKKHFLKKISYKELSTISFELSKNYQYISDKLNEVNEILETKQINVR